LSKILGGKPKYWGQRVVKLKPLLGYNVLIDIGAARLDDSMLALCAI